MNTSNVIRSVKLSAPAALTVSIKSRASGMWRKLMRRLFAEQVVGNPLHEAWTADGEPLECVSPQDAAKSDRYRHLGHSRASVSR